MSKKTEPDSIQVYEPPRVQGDRERSASELLEQLQQIAARADAGHDVFQDCIAAGLDASKGLDYRRLVIGALCALVQRKYGASNVEEFAKAVGVGVSTVRQYQDIVEFYELSTCVELVEYPNLYYSHMRLAIVVRDRAAALALLDRVVENSWTVKELHKEIYGTPPDAEIDDEPAEKEVKILDIDRAEFRRYDMESGEITIHVGDKLTDLIGYRTAHVVMKVPAVAELPPPSPLRPAAEDFAGDDILDWQQPYPDAAVVDGVAYPVDPVTGEVMIASALVPFEG